MFPVISDVFALVLFVIAGFMNEHPWKSRIACFGLACLAAAELIKSWPR